MLSIIMAAALAAPAPALPEAATEPKPSIITSAQWLRKPDAGDIVHYYPRKARRKGLDGHARMKCLVTAVGTLRDCVILEESPQGERFGEATIRLGALFKMTPEVQGRSVEGATVVIPILWRNPSSDTPRKLSPAEVDRVIEAARAIRAAKAAAADAAASAEATAADD